LGSAASQLQAMGEPTTYGTTIRRSNQLSYIHHIALPREFH